MLHTGGTEEHKDADSVIKSHCTTHALKWKCTCVYNLIYINNPSACIVQYMNSKIHTHAYKHTNSIQIQTVRTCIHYTYVRMYCICELHQVANNDVIEAHGCGFKWQ